MSLAYYAAAGMVLAIVCIGGAVAGQEAAPSPDHPVGWRGDGNGRYPAADPPLAWGRLSVAVKELRLPARKDPNTMRS